MDDQAHCSHRVTHGSGEYESVNDELCDDRDVHSIHDYEAARRAS